MIIKIQTYDDDMTPIIQERHYKLSLENVEAMKKNIEDIMEDTQTEIENTDFDELGIEEKLNRTGNV